MKLFEKLVTTRRVPNSILMILAVCIATSMWYGISQRDNLEAQIDVNIDYTGIPGNLVITHGLVNKLNVRLRGAEMLVRSIPNQYLNQVINLSGIKKGETVVPITSAVLGPGFRAFDIIDIQPTRLVIKADTIIERSVPLHEVIDTSIGKSALTVDNVVLYPSSVILKGPEEILNKIPTLPIIIHVDPKSGAKKVEDTITLDTPAFVTAQPSSIRVNYTITSGRNVVPRQCNINFAGSEKNKYELTPKKMSLLVEVPEALAKDANYLNQIRITVSTPALNLNESRRVVPHFDLPEGMTLLNHEPEDVIITRIHD